MPQGAPERSSRSILSSIASFLLVLLGGIILGLMWLLGFLVMLPGQRDVFKRLEANGPVPPVASIAINVARALGTNWHLIYPAGLSAILFLAAICSLPRVRWGLGMAAVFAGASVVVVATLVAAVLFGF